MGYIFFPLVWVDVSAVGIEPVLLWPSLARSMLTGTAWVPLFKFRVARVIRIMIFAGGGSAHFLFVADHLEPLYLLASPSNSEHARGVPTVKCCAYSGYPSRAVWFVHQILPFSIRDLTFCPQQLILRGQI
jgi:hypothetical protein